MNELYASRSTNITTHIAEAFMAYVEKDAEARAANRRERKAIADDYKKKANEAFRTKDYEKALRLYNKVNFKIRYEGWPARRVSGAAFQAAT
jgi:hypothetical protein